MPIAVVLLLGTSFNLYISLNTFFWYSKPTATLMGLRAGSLLGIKPVIQQECTASY